MRAAIGVSGQRGYVLVVVLGALALIALVAARFAQRIDELRAQTATLAAHAEHQLKAANALAATLYVVSTTTPGPGGFGPRLSPVLLADDRIYRLPDGGEAQVQDVRGLLTLHGADRALFTRVLTSFGLPPRDADGWYDVLADHVDTDNLKRLNGAEAAEYEALGLPPPRNDWLLTAREAANMPLWRDHPAIADRVIRLASINRTTEVNPNTAPIALLAAMLPQASPQQLELFDTLRRSTPFVSGAAARAATGLAVDNELFSFHLGMEHRLTVSTQGAARALQYNLFLTPSGPQAPWLISDVYPVQRTRRSDNQDRASPFPLDIASSPGSGAPSPPAEPRSARIEW